MRGSLASLVLILTVGTAPAHAATGVESARKTAQAAQERVNDIRAQQMTLRSELNQIAGRIETLKARSRGALLKRGELESSLRRSQELSGLLTEAAQQLSQAEAQLERDQVALLSSLSAELEALRNEWDRTQDRQVRADLLRRLREIRAEREQVRAGLPPERVPALDVRGSDDPEDLLEQANALRDSEDKVRQQIKALQSRIAEMRRERELDRRMSDFVGEERLFDEQDRRLGSAAPSSSLRAPAPGGGSPVMAADSAPAAYSLGPGPGASSSPSAPASTLSASPTSSGSSGPSIPDSRPLVGGGDPLALNGADPRELSALEGRLKRLESLAQQLDARASEIEARAREARY